MIAPWTWMGWPVHQRAYRLLPFEAFRNVVPFEIVPAWEAQEHRLHRGKLLHDVYTISIAPASIGRRKQRDQLQPERTRVGASQSKMVRSRGLHSRGSQADFIPLPLLVDRRDRGRCHRLTALVID